MHHPEILLKEAMGAQNTHGWDVQGSAGKWAVCINRATPSDSQGACVSCRCVSHPQGGRQPLDLDVWLWRKHNKVLHIMLPLIYDQHIVDA